MARYTYNSSLVEQTIDELSQACSAITNTNSEIQKGISAITSARGGELFADVGFGTITGYESAVTEMVDSMSTLIRQKAQEIEEYESAPWYKKLWNSLAMGALKVVEGIASVGENLMDGVVSLAGFVGGVFNSDFQDSVAEFIKKDHVGEAFYNDSFNFDINYEELLKNINCPTLFMKANTIIAENGVVQGALTDEDLSKVDSLIKDMDIKYFNCGHGIHNEKSKEFVSSIRSFLSKEKIKDEEIELNQ